MSRRPVVEVGGLRTLRRTLKAAGQSLDHDFKSVHKEVADIVAAAARRTSPVGPAAGGHIRDDIRAAGQSAAAVVRAGRAALPYAGPLHWGWPAGAAHHQKAQPWILDAAAATQSHWLPVYARGLEKIIDDIKGAPGP
jgi:hypothetical protein